MQLSRAQCKFVGACDKREKNWQVTESIYCHRMSMMLAGNIWGRHTTTRSCS
jgi:hypothetical protein